MLLPFCIVIGGTSLYSVSQDTIFIESDGWKTAPSNVISVFDAVNVRYCSNDLLFGGRLNSNSFGLISDFTINEYGRLIFAVLVIFRGR